MHHGTCVTHMPWCMSGSPTRGGEENVPGIPGTCTTRKFTYLTKDPWGKDEVVLSAGTFLPIITQCLLVCSLFLHIPNFISGYDINISELFGNVCFSYNLVINEEVRGMDLKRVYFGNDSPRYMHFRLSHGTNCLSKSLPILTQQYCALPHTWKICTNYLLLGLI